MPFTLKMPKLSPTMEEGTIAKWHIKEGDLVKEGDLLMEVATDKATVEYAAIDEGYIRKILISEGSEAEINQPIAIMTEDKAESIEGFEVEKKKVIEEKPQETEEEIEPLKVKTAESLQQAFFEPSFVPEPPLETFDFIPSTDPFAKVKASPLAKKIAKDRGLDLTGLRGSGPGGRIMKRDLKNAKAAGGFGFNRAYAIEDMPGSYEEIKLSPMRRAISKRLQEAKSFIPHFYVSQVVDAEPIFFLREQLKKLGLKVSFNDCVVKACSLSLKKHPNVNAGFNSVNKTVVMYKTVDISVAVSVEGGLITPIIRVADCKDIGQISQEIRELAKRAKDGKLQDHEYKGGSFTVSNLGMYGITDFSAIINPPQACILAVGGILDEPVVKDGSVVAGKTMKLTLSCDHRVVDGVLGAVFINSVKHYLENPASLILG